jgi:integrase
VSKELWGSGYVYQRGRVWWFNYSVRGKEYRKSAHTKKRAEAVKALKLAVGESANGKVVIAPVAERVTLKAMLDALSDDYKHKGNRPTIAAASRYLLEHFGENARALNLTEDALLRYVSARRAMLIKRATGKEIIVKGKTVVERILQPPSNGTINFELAILRCAFNIMVRAKKLSRDHVPAMPMFKKKTLKVRQGFLEPAAFERLYAALPVYLRDPIRFLFLSGWRKNEMATLEWRDIELERDERGEIIAGIARLRPEQSKNDEARALPLPGELLEIVARAHTARSLACPRVFQRDGAPLGSFRKAWASACKAAGFSGLLVHDLRRSAVRNLVDSGLPDGVAMLITGHKTRSIFDRYNIRDETDVKAAMAKAVEWVSAQAKLRPKVVPLRRTA